MSPPFRSPARPGALIGVFPKDLGMATGDHRLLNIHPVDEQLSDSPSITVGGDPAKADSPSFDHHPQVIAGRFGTFRPSPLSSQLRSVDAGQPDSFAVRGSAGVAVVAAANGHGLQGRSRNPKQQQQGH